MNSSSPSAVEYSDTSLGEQTLGSFGYGIGFSIAVLLVFLVITYFSYKCKRSQTRAAAAAFHHHSSADYGGAAAIHVVIQHGGRGLSAAAIADFPLFTYAQLKPHKAASGCAVCLADYKDSETLRMLPECGHVFHRSCIDPWLMIHPTCPVCRSSPLPTPVETPPPPPPLTQPAAPVAN